jgi:WD40 repeat protein
MGLPGPPHRSKVPWALAVTVGLCAGLAGYVIRVAQDDRVPKQVVKVRRVTDLAGSEESPAISPDGKSIAFVASVGDKRQIWIGKPITKDNADHFGPRWTPDSKGLIYFSADAIWEIPATGGDARKLVDALAPGDLSRDGKLAFFRHDGDGVDLMVDARTVAKLTGTSTYSNLRWSPDDKKIAYVQDGNVMAVSASGGEPVVAADGRIQGFTWTPDNTGMIVSTHGELWFVPRAERGSPSQLTFGELSYESPDMSPKGSLAVSRRDLATGADADIVLFTGLKW